MQVVADQSVFIQAAIESIKHHLIEGSFFACVIIYFFLANWRTTLIAAIAIPTSIIATFALMAIEVRRLSAKDRGLDATTCSGLSVSRCGRNIAKHCSSRVSNCRHGRALSTGVGRAKNSFAPITSQ